MSTESARPLPARSALARPAPVARRMALVAVWTLALAIGWPASMPWLEPAAMINSSGNSSGIPSGSSPDTQTISGWSSGWIRSAEAQNRRRRRNRPARRNRRPAAPARDESPAAAPSSAAPDAPAAGPQGKGKDENKVFDFTGLDISGQLRAPQLLYFLDRAAEELDRASLERRSFIPEMVQSIDEESL